MNMMWKPPAGPRLVDCLVADHFGVKDGVLSIAGIPVDDLARIYGTPFFAYDADIMRANYKRLTKAVHGFAEVYYSIKCNPRAEVAAVFHEQGAGLEIASIGEFRSARKARCEPSRIIFAGPGKSPEELSEAITAGIGEIHLESFEEIEHVAAIAATTGRTVPVSIRVNPEAVAQGGAMRMGGKPTAFGFDEEILPDVIAAIGRHEQLDLHGVHLFAGTQILKADVLTTQWRHGLAVAAKVARLAGKPLKTIDLGGGLGVPYHAAETYLDVVAVSQAVPDLIALKNSDPLLRDANVILEPGRYLMANAGIYVMQVRASKMSRGKRFLVTDGGMHHHLAASGNLGQTIKRDYPIVPAGNMDDIELSEASIVGPLCTPLDTLGRNTQMPELKQGDLIAILQSGAYGATASPSGFLSHAPATEILLDAGRHQSISP